MCRNGLKSTHDVHSIPWVAEALTFSSTVAASAAFASTAIVSATSATEFPLPQISSFFFIATTPPMSLEAGDQAARFRFRIQEDIILHLFYEKLEAGAQAKLKV